MAHIEAEKTPASPAQSKDWSSPLQPSDKSVSFVNTETSGSLFRGLRN